MSSAPFSDFVATSAAGPGVDVVHLCARHPEMRGDRGCTQCSNALCTACARSLPHRVCPDCRQQAGEPAHVVDASWRIQLLIDSLMASVKAVPRRLPALAAILAVALFAPVGLWGLADPDDSAAVTMGVIGGLFAAGVFGLGMWLQPLIVLPTIERTSKGRVLLGALLGAFVVYAPMFVLALMAIPLEKTLYSSEVVGQLYGMAFMLVCGITVPLGLLWQARVVMGQGPSVRGLFGTVVAHGVVAGLWISVLAMVCLPLLVVTGLGVLVDPAVAGVVGVVSGVVVWLLLLVGMGSFAAGSARYSVDLERLS
ncbi:MAG: B-box zinc finger protein [Deltaproteobacteria bacterium]|nr:B-box zinc finger protein [Deltaproteobacteria bacterium]